MAVRAFNGAVLMGDAGIVARRRHAVMVAELIVAARQVCAGLGVEIAEGRRKAVGTVLARYATERPQGVLQPFRQGHETLPAEHDMGVFEAGIGQPEVIEPVIQRGASDRNAGIAHVSEIRKAHPARLMHLPENDLTLRAMNGAPRSDAPLQRAANAAAQLGMPPDHLLKIATERRPGEACSMGTTSALKISPNGSGRRRS